MLKVIKINTIIICLFLSSQLFASKNFDGNQVLQMCQAQSTDMSAGCAMFIVGAAESLRMVGLNGERYCIVEEVNNHQLRQEFVAFLLENSDSLNYSAASLFYVNLLKNHPCEKKK